MEGIRISVIMSSLNTTKMTTKKEFREVVEQVWLRPWEAGRPPRCGFKVSNFLWP